MEKTVILQYGFFDSAVRFPRTKRTKPRAVVSYELEYITSSAHGVAHLGSRDVALEESMILLAKPGITRYSDLDFQCYCFHFTTDDPALRSLLHSLPELIPHADPDFFLPLFQDAIRYSPDVRPEDTLALHSLLYRILAKLVEDSGVHLNLKEEKLLPYAELFRETDRFIRTSLGSALDLKTLSAHAALSPVYFHKLFTEYFGVTPQKYVLNKRIDAARILLSGTTKSLSEIAEECGFSSQSYFSTRFREAISMTPNEYRRHAMNRIEV